jgi:PAS domain-containing protein
MFEISILLMIFSTGMLLLVAMLNRQSTAIHMPSVKSENCNSGLLETDNQTDMHAERAKKPPPMNASDQFIQTMSATFAHLQIGIAVFDNNNELSLFNPALSQHLGLRPEWLLKKPNLPGFLDRLRDTHILPEPVNYTSWRKTFMKIERSAMKDDYREDWDLPDGRSLRVVGRPHPSGTVVFLFEDVTNVLAMERRFRAQISNLENIINTTATGLIAFDRTGKVIFQNNTMKRIVGADYDSNSIQEFSCMMQAVFYPTPIWGDLRQYVEETERSAWQASVETQTGETVLVNVEPMPTGDTLCEFHFLIKINQDTCDGLACAAQ